MRVVVAMSGGVDSSVAAALLAEAGHEVIGLSMQLYDQRDGESGYGSCCSLDDLHDAGRVARRLNIPHYIVNFEREFQRTVVSNFIDEYVAGRTPIPCAHCNSDSNSRGGGTLSIGRWPTAQHWLATGHTLSSHHAGPPPCFAALMRRRTILFSVFADAGQLSRARSPWRSAKDAVPTSRGDGPVGPGKPTARNRFGEAITRLHRAHTESREGGSIVSRRRVLGRHGAVHRSPSDNARGRNARRGTDYVLQLVRQKRRSSSGRARARRTCLSASSVNWIAGAPDTPQVSPHKSVIATSRLSAPRALEDNRSSMEFDAPSWRSSRQASCL